VFRRTAVDSDSDSDSGSVETSGTVASERTPLLMSGAFSAATNTPATGTCYVFSFGTLLTSEHTESGITLIMQFFSQLVPDKGPLSVCVCICVEGTTEAAANTTVDVETGSVTSAGLSAGHHWGQSSVEVHYVESPSSPDQHITSSALVVDAGLPGEPLSSEPAASCSFAVSADTSASASHAAFTQTDNDASSSYLMSPSQHIIA